MSISIQALSTGTFAPVLGSLSAILVKAIDFAAAKGVESSALASARLAPDMFTLAQQVQTACDQAKGCAARLAGQEPPVFADDEQTLEALKARIDRTLAYLDSIPAAAFAGAEERRIVIPGPGEIEFHFNGLEYVRDWALPHFYFHVVTAYDILRHEGLQIGKPDYMSHVVRYIRQRAPAESQA